MRLFWRRAWRALGVIRHLGLGVLLCALWLAPLARFWPLRSRPHRHKIIHWWMQRLLITLRVRLHVTGTLHDSPVLLVANHISWLDIPCLLSHADAVFVAKSDVARWPLIGWLATVAGTIYLERGHGAAAAITHMTAALAAGQSTLIFPEGTSTDGRTVRPFHSRLFQAALTCEASVQPLAIRYLHDGAPHPRVPFVGDDSFVSHLWRLLGEERIEAELLFLAPCPGRGERRVLAEKCRTRILAALGPIAGEPVTESSRDRQGGFIQAGHASVPSFTQTPWPWTTAHPGTTAPGASLSTRSTRR